MILVGGIHATHLNSRRFHRRTVAIIVTVVGWQWFFCLRRDQASTRRVHCSWGLGDLPGRFLFSVSHRVSRQTENSRRGARSYSASGTEAFRWTQTTGMVGIGDLPGRANFSALRLVPPQTGV